MSFTLDKFPSVCREKPNASGELLPKAGARDERTLLAVSSTALFGWLRGYTAGQPEVTAVGILGHPAYLLSSYLYTAYFTTAAKDRLTLIDVLTHHRPRRFLVHE